VTSFELRIIILWRRAGGALWSDGTLDRIDWQRVVWQWFIIVQALIVQAR
jgi:hypothetical protein